MHFVTHLFWNPRERRIRSFWRLSIHVLALMAGMIMLAIAFQVFAMFVNLNHYQASMSIWAVMQNLMVLSPVVVACLWPDRRQCHDRRQLWS